MNCDTMNCNYLSPSGYRGVCVRAFVKHFNPFLFVGSWLHEIKQKHSEMVNARMMAEKLRQREQFLNTENEMLKV